jgi:hypothetical protein
MSAAYLQSQDISVCMVMSYKLVDQVSVDDRQGGFCKIWGFHGGDYEEWFLLGCYAVWLL